jgi:hypothetical protein
MPAGLLCRVTSLPACLDVRDPVGTGRRSRYLRPRTEINPSAIEPRQFTALCPPTNSR